MDELSSEVESLEVVLDIECRQLLETAVIHAFAMIAHVDPTFDLKCLRDSLPPAKELSLVNLVQKEVSAFVKRFGPEEKEEGTSAGGGGDVGTDDDVYEAAE